MIFQHCAKERALRILNFFSRPTVILSSWLEFMDIFSYHAIKDFYV